MLGAWINSLADWSTFNSASGTVPNSHPHSRACIKSNTHSYADSEPDTITKPSTCRNASPTFTPPQIASHPVRAIRVYDDAGNVIERHEHAGDFKELVKQKATKIKKEKGKKKRGSQKF